MKIKAFLILVLLVLSLSFASAIIVNSVSVEKVSPGKEGTIRVQIENILNEDVIDVSFAINFVNTGFTPLGSSEEGIDELRDGDDETFSFRFKTSNTLSPGDYQVPYTLRYTQDDVEKKREGSIGITVDGDTELSFAVDTENPVIEREGKINLRIINKGFSDAKFMSVKIFPDGYALLSEQEVYIGSVDSDDFETASFDVIFKSESPRLVAIVEYKDFDNKKNLENLNIPLTIYTQEKAIELGIIERNNTFLYIAGVFVLIVIFFLWRSARKKRRMRKSMGE